MPARPRASARPGGPSRRRQLHALPWPPPWVGVHSGSRRPREPFPCGQKGLAAPPQGPAGCDAASASARPALGALKPQPLHPQSTGPAPITSGHQGPAVETQKSLPASPPGPYAQACPLPCSHVGPPPGKGAPSCPAFPTIDKAQPPTSPGAGVLQELAQAGVGYRRPIPQGCQD